MYIQIGSKKYRELRNLRFSPQTDITGDSIPINGFTVDVRTGRDITVGKYVTLYDDLNQLWAKFWIVSANRLDEDFVQVEAKSSIYLLERVTLPAVIYTSATAITTALNEIFTAVPYVDYSISSAASAKTVQGYCPEQNGRERLQWICFACGLYVEQYFADRIYIKVLDQSSITEIPMDKTFWRPSVNYKDYVTAIIGTYYSFSAGTPQSGDDHVTVDGVDYIMTKTEITLSNPDVVETTPQNEVKVKNVTLLNINNVSQVLSRLSLIYFERIEVNADIINNLDYSPAQRVGITLDEKRGAVGYIESTSFTFGLQAKSDVRLVGCSLRDMYPLIIRYMNNGACIAIRRYFFPEGLLYEIENPYIDISTIAHRYVFRPVNQYATGEIEDEENIDEEDVELALHYYGDQRLLFIYSVSEVESDGEGVVEIG